MPDISCLDICRDPLDFRLHWPTLGAVERQAYVWPENIEYADLSGLDLAYCDFSGRCLYGADLRGADITETNFQDADLRQAKIDAFCREYSPKLDGALCDPDSYWEILKLAGQNYLFLDRDDFRRAGVIGVVATQAVDKQILMLRDALTMSLKGLKSLYVTTEYDKRSVRRKLETLMDKLFPTLIEHKDSILERIQVLGSEDTISLDNYLHKYGRSPDPFFDLIIIGNTSYNISNRGLRYVTAQFMRSPVLRAYTMSEEGEARPDKDFERWREGRDLDKLCYASYNGESDQLRVQQTKNSIHKDSFYQTEWTDPFGSKLVIAESSQSESLDTGFDIAV